MTHEETSADEIPSPPAKPIDPQETKEAEKSGPAPTEPDERVGD